MRRRFITIPALLFIAALATLSVPLWITALLVVGVVRRKRFIALRLSLFVLIYAWMELFGVLVMMGAWLVGQSGRSSFHYALQRIWANTLFRAMKGLLQLRVQVEGSEVLESGPFLLLMRHTSIADTVLPAALLTAQRGIRLRYVLKKELRADPCLDIAGGRLPNHFLDRLRVDAAELQGIASLASGLSDGEAVLIYPEGTRFTESVRTRRIEKLKASGSSRVRVAEELRHTLLPKLRGVAALHQAAPHLDVVVFAHHGFEGFATLGSMLSGELVGRAVCVRFWRRSAAKLSADIPSWLDEEWRRVDAWVGSFPEEKSIASARSTNTDDEGPFVQSEASERAAPKALR